MIEYERLYAFLMDKLERELPDYLTYHHAGHTKSVIAAAWHLGVAEHLKEEDLILLKTAALLHDAGYLEHYSGHEAHSAQMAVDILPAYGYNREQIDAICEMIAATRLPSTPANLLEQILCDADLYYLGDEQYGILAEKLFPEMKKFGILKTKTEWLLKQVEFLSAHSFHTATAVREREVQKQKNLQQLRSRLEAGFTTSKGSKPMEIVQDILLTLTGVLFAGYALKGFLVPNHFFDGGVT